MIFATGDKHGEIDFRDLANKRFPLNRELTRDDYVIILGDWGVFWSPDAKSEKTKKYLLKFYNERRFTTLVIHGNHDNIPSMNECPEVPMFGSTVKQLSDNVFYLLNSHVYTINGKTFFVLGGGLSIDKLQRREDFTWWKEEIPSYMEMKQGFDLLSTMGNKVDYILTHAIFEDGYDYLFGDISGYKENDPMHKSLQVLKETVNYKRWFCGHYHHDEYVESLKTQFLYHKVVKIE